MKAEALRLVVVGTAILMALSGRAQAQLFGVSETIAPLPRFDGTWFEIATYGSWWHRRCVRDTTLVLAARTTVEGVVRSRCQTAGGTEVRNGRMSSRGSDGRWRSHFVPAFFAWLPVVWTDFWILGHDERLTWFVAGERGHERLSVFSRTASLDESSRALALALARQAGFDVTRLVEVAHDPDGWRDVPQATGVSAGRACDARARRASWASRP